MIKGALIVIFPLALVAAAYYWRDALDRLFPQFKGWRTVILNGASAGLILASELVAFAAGFNWGSILSVEAAAYMTLGVNLANIVMRFATNTAVGEK